MKLLYGSLCSLVVSAMNQILDTVNGEYHVDEIYMRPTDFRRSGSHLVSDFEPLNSNPRGSPCE